MNTQPPLHGGEFVLYQTEDGRNRIECHLVDGTIWLTQMQMGELFHRAKQTISEHLQNIFEEGELTENAVVRNFRTTAADGKTYDVVHYNLDAILAVGELSDAATCKLASLRDASLGTHGPVVSLVPRSTTGYRLPCLRHGGGAEAEGFPACSRWLSAATPPEPEHHENRTPAGVLARDATHAFHAHQPALPPDFRHQEPRAETCAGVAWPTSRVPRRNSAGPRRPSPRCGRRGRPCTSSRLAQGHPLPGRLHAGIEKSRFRLDSGNPSAAGFPLAGRLCRLHGQRLRPGFRSGLHRPTRGPSPEGTIPERIAGDSQKIRCRIRRAVSGLTPPLLASLRDASPGTHGPVVSLVPRSTTGYRLRSLRLPGSRQQQPQQGKPICGPMPGSDRLLRRHHAEGMATCSRWLSAATPPEPEPEHPMNRTPAGVPAIQTHTIPPNPMCLEELGGERTTLPEPTEHQTQEAEGFQACSRWLSAATPPEPEPEHPMNRTPAGVPAIQTHTIPPNPACLAEMGKQAKRKCGK